MLEKYKRMTLILFRFIMLTVAVIIIQFSFAVVAHAEEKSEEEAVLEQQARSKEINGIEEQLQKHSGREIKDIIQGYDPQSILQDVAKGKFDFSLTGILNRALQYIFKEIYLNVHVLIKLVILVVLCALLKNLQASFLNEGVGELAFYACYIIIVSIVIVSFSSAMKLGLSIIDTMVDFMYATVPVLITLLVSGGNITSGGVFQPVIVMIVEVAATVFKNVFIPLIFLSTILSIVNNISEKVQVSKLAGLLKQVTGWALGLILTIFVAVISLQGTVGAVVDGVTSKTAKFAIGAFIPVVGGYLADAADTVIGCTLLIKNAAGIAVMVGIITICLVPLLKMLALIALYRITCVLIEPISEKRITNCINDVAGSLTFIFGIVASVAFMFLIAITAIIGASNLSAMVR